MEALLGLGACTALRAPAPSSPPAPLHTLLLDAGRAGLGQAGAGAGAACAQPRGRGSPGSPPSGAQHPASPELAHVPSGGGWAGPAGLGRDGCALFWT